MKGSGTAADPFLVSSVDDLRSISSANSYYKLTTDLDVNNSEFKDGWTNAAMKCAEFNGNNFKISNIACRDHAVFTLYGDTVIKNLALKGMYLSDSPLFAAYSENQTVTLENCIIEAEAHSVSSGYDVFISHTFETMRLTKNTVLNLKLITTAQISMHALFPSTFADTAQLCIDWHVIEPWESTRAVLFSSMGSLSDYFKNSFITGKVDCSLNLASDFSDCYIENSYLAVAAPALNLSSGGSKPHINGVCFFDKDLTDSFTVEFSGTGKLHALKTEQCKSLSYLQSIGFPVVSDV